jgi:FxLD family lantipeptide
MPDTSIATTADLDLDVTIVVAGPPAAALLSSTDDNCDTRKDGDC